jgi:hypothetical protein
MKTEKDAMPGFRLHIVPKKLLALAILMGCTGCGATPDASTDTASKQTAASQAANYRIAKKTDAKPSNTTVNNLKSSSSEHPSWLVGYFSIFENCGTTSGDNLTSDGYWTNGEGEGSGGTWTYKNGIKTLVFLYDDNEPRAGSVIELKVTRTIDGFIEKSIKDGPDDWPESRYYRCGSAEILPGDMARLKKLKSQKL